MPDIERESYPGVPSARDRFIVERRGPREAHDPWRHQGVMVEDERAEDGSIARVATVFLTGRECPWRCVMCDLWRYTIEEDTPAGAIPAQIAAARHASRASVMKLYNAGSFFDPGAVPEADYDDIAAQLVGLERVIVESHPALIGARVDRFLDALARAEARAKARAVRGEKEPSGCERSEDAQSDRALALTGPRLRLEVAMGLETAHPVALERLHKRVTLEGFARAAEELRRRDVALRVFMLISPPFIPADEQDMWLLRSIDFAFECGASAVSLIPTRPGNGAMEALRDEGLFRVPTLEDIERSFAAARRGRERVFVDLWDLERFADGDAGGSDFVARRERLRLMNLEAAS
jgi:archaeosine synthase beta-subunit